MRSNIKQAFCNLYFVIARNSVKWCIYKPLRKVQNLIDCGKLNRPSLMHPVRIKWLGRLNYRLVKFIAFYGL